MYSPIYDAKERVFAALIELRQTIETFGDPEGEYEHIKVAHEAIAKVKNEWE